MKDLGVHSDKKNSNIVVSSKNCSDLVPFYKEQSYMLDDTSFIKFIKNVEMQVRTSKEYKAYIYYLKNTLSPPLNHCMVYSNMTDDKCIIEMHHFLFTLFDIVEIIIGWHFKSNIPFSSSRIFHVVMEEHRLHNVSVIMLSQAVHNAIHNKNKDDTVRFLDYRMAHGNIVEFLNKYYSGLSFNHIGKIKRYLEQHEQFSKKPIEEFFDEVITKWNSEIMI